MKIGKNIFITLTVLAIAIATFLFYNHHKYVIFDGTYRMNTNFALETSEAMIIPLKN